MATLSSSWRIILSFSSYSSLSPFQIQPHFQNLDKLRNSPILRVNLVPLTNAVFHNVSSRAYYTSLAISATSQIARLGRLGQIDNAHKLFDQLPHDKPIASWNSIIAAYFQSSMPNEARLLFDKMPERNTVSWSGFISSYVNNGMVDEARKIFDTMKEQNVVSWTAMVRGYVREGKIEEAESLFWRMPEKNVISLTVMMDGLIQEGRIDDARQLYDKQTNNTHSVYVTNNIHNFWAKNRGRMDNT